MSRDRLDGRPVPSAGSLTRRRMPVEEPEQFGRHFLRQFLGQEVSAGQAFPANVERLLPPQGEDIVVSPDEALAAPQDQQGAFDLPRGIRGIVRQVDAGGGAVIVAAAADGLRIRKAAHVLGDHLRIERGLVAHAPAGQAALQPVRRIVGDHAFREGRRLDQEEPVEIAGRQGLVGHGEGGRGGRDVHRAGAQDAVRMVEAEAVEDARAAVVRRHVEAPVAERTHQPGHVPRHGPLRLVGGLRHGRRHPRIAVAPQVGNHEREALLQERRDLVPHGMGFGIAVEQQQGRAPRVLPDPDMDARGADIDVPGGVA